MRNVGGPSTCEVAKVRAAVCRQRFKTATFHLSGAAVCCQTLGRKLKEFEQAKMSLLAEGPVDVYSYSCSGC